MRNSDIAELLARSAEHAKQPLQRALRRAARRAFLWPEEAEEIHARGESLTVLSGIGPYLNKQIIDWLRHPPEPVERVPDIRRNFLTLAEATILRSKYPERFSEIRGDLQMHTLWSDGSGSVQDMVEAAVSRGYSYVAITDHSKGLKIAGGMDEEQLAKQAAEITVVNEGMRENAHKFCILRSVELNLSPTGAGDMEQAALDRLLRLVIVVRSSETVAALPPALSLSIF